MTVKKDKRTFYAEVQTQTNLLKCVCVSSLKVIVSQASPIPFHSADRFQYWHAAAEDDRRCRLEWGWLSRLTQGVGLATWKMMLE